MADAVLLSLDKGSGEPRVAAVVVPAPVAWDAVATDGRRALAKTLSEHLAAHFERVLVPRAWRFVAALPSKAQGKIPRDALRALFAAGAPPEAPEYLSVARSERTLEARVRIPWDLASLDGHFPGTPIVAGVVQLHFAMRALEELLGEEPALGSLEALKFHDVLLPRQEALLRVELQDQGRFQFSLRDAERPERSFASGRGRLEPRR